MKQIPIQHGQLNLHTYITNGAFKMKEWIPKDVMTFVKNDKYWDAKSIKLDTLHYKMIEDSTAALSAFKAGQMELYRLHHNQKFLVL